MNIKQLNEKIHSILKEDFSHHSIMSKDIAILRYLAGAIALSSEHTINHYDEDNLFFNIETDFTEYSIIVEDGIAYLDNTPDLNHETISARAQIDFVVGQDITKPLNKAIQMTEVELYPQLKEVQDDPELSLMAKDILDMGKNESIKESEERYLSVEPIDGGCIPNTNLEYNANIVLYDGGKQIDQIMIPLNYDEIKGNKDEYIKGIAKDHFNNISDNIKVQWF